MDKEIGVLMLTATTVGLLHTLMGPDHYIPFAAMSQARDWSKGRTFWVTTLCGIGHVASSVILGMVGILAGVSLVKLKFIESMRGEIAAWFLLAFGMGYLSWALVNKFRGSRHVHDHAHESEASHAHDHDHHHDHLHVHAVSQKGSLTPWLLFIIFFFGPCEPLIPLVMYPALKSNWTAVSMVVLSFGVVTLITMQLMVFLSLSGLSAIKLKFDRHAGAIAGFSHITAGAAVFICGILIKFCGL